MKMVLFAPNIQTSIINEFISTVPPMLFQYLMVGAFIAYLRMLWEDPDSILHHFIEDKEDEK